MKAINADKLIEKIYKIGFPDLYQQTNSISREAVIRAIKSMPDIKSEVIKEYQDYVDLGE